MSNFDEFVEWTKEYAIEHNKKIEIRDSKTLKIDGVSCSGWCDEDQLVVAKQNKNFKRIYTHEFSHMTQVVEGSPLWAKDTGKFWKELAEGTLHGINSWDNLMCCVELEHDCEKRAIALAKKWKLFDAEEYARGANLYLHYYQFVFLNKKWLGTGTIYKKKLLAVMPNKLVPFKSLKKIDMDLMKLYSAELTKKK